ncbi:pyridoxamine 5'-phosphate oxidase family protein [Flindersiella endophytica]
MTSSSPSKLAQVRRKPYRARYDHESIHAVLDEAYVSHVATVRDGLPVVLPMAHARLGDQLILHGSPAAGLFRDVRRGSRVCVTTTLLDGLVLGRAARVHSMNYRSVTIHGEAAAITDSDEALEAFRALIEHVEPGRWEKVRRPTRDEIRETGLWRVPIVEASLKSRTGGVLGEEADRDWPVWAGHIPARLSFGEPVPAP